MSTKNVEKNLMDFNSPLSFEKMTNSEIDSPGSNPFDSLLQAAETFNDVDVNRESLNFPGNIDIDCERESIGVLHVDFEKLEFTDTNWLNVPEIQVNNEETSQNCLENLSSQLNTAFLYSSRNNKKSGTSSVISSISSFPESLELWDFSKIHVSKSSINSTNSESVSILNKGFFNWCDTKSKIVPNINEKYCLDTSRPRIQSLPDVLQKKESLMNVNENTIAEKGINLYLKNFRKSESLLKRSFTLPQILKQCDEVDDEFNDSVFIEAKHIATKIADESILDTANGELFSLDCTPQPEWLENCDAFEEENIVSYAEKIFKTVDKLIPSVNVNSPSLTSDAKDKDCKTPDEEKSLETNKFNFSTRANSTNSNSSLSRNECLQNLSDIFNCDTKRLSTSRTSVCSNNSKSKDAKSILHNLSEILSNENPTAQQKSEGQSLLFNLADILCSSDNREQSEDSGHSSIDQEIFATNKQEDINCDALDLRVNVVTPVEESKPLDLSVSKKKKQNEEKKSVVVSTSYVQESNTSLKISPKTSNNGNLCNNKTRNESTNSNDSKNLSNLKTNISGLPSFGKLKPKKIDKKLIPDKGPLKAMIPVGNMSKPKGINKSNKINSTPPKGNQYTSMYNIKRTSTPKSELKPQPVAQSTPEANMDRKKQIPLLRQKRFDSPVSPLPKTNSIGNESTEDLNKKNRSNSAPNLSSSCASKDNSSVNSSQAVFRRRSASDLKLSKNAVKIKRSNTIDKDSGIAKTLSRVRANVEKARTSSLPDSKATGNTKPAQNKLILGERNRVSSSSNIKPYSLMNKMRRSAGKENIGK